MTSATALKFPVAAGSLELAKNVLLNFEKKKTGVLAKVNSFRPRGLFSIHANIFSVNNIAT